MVFFNNNITPTTLQPSFIMLFWMVLSLAALQAASSPVLGQAELNQVENLHYVNCYESAPCKLNRKRPKKCEKSTGNECVLIELMKESTPTEPGRQV